MTKEPNSTQASVKLLAPLIATMRLPFLILTPACLLLAFALVYKNTMLVQWPLIVLVSVGAICAHIAVNMLNEYTDFTSGLDLDTQRTPFSGGSGGLPAQPSAKRVVFAVALMNLVVCCLIGLYLSFVVGPQLLTIGLLGVLIIITYTRWINRLPFLCLISPGLAFGVLLVNGSYFVLTQSFRLDVILISLIPFFLTNNLLLLNQFPDIDADKKHGRKHMLIQYGVLSGANTYLLHAILSVITLTALIYWHYLPYASAFALLPLLFSITIGIQLRTQVLASDNKPIQSELMPLMGRNVAVTIITPLILSLSIVLSKA